MTEQPTSYDLQQDEQIARNTRMIKPDHTPRDGTEYSFPVVGQGISSREYQLMSLGQANGIIHGDNGEVNTSPDSTGWRYYLDKHNSDAETNQRNTLILRAGTSAEAIVEGFYHRLTEDMEISLPPVISRTVYHVCITFDPEKETEPQGPVSIRTYPSVPPSSGGRVHLLLYQVERQPNQLLTEATVTRYRPYTAGLLSVQNRNQLPDPAQYPAGTLVVPSAEGQGLYVRQNGGLVWLDPISHKANKPGSWQSLATFSGWNSSNAFFRITDYGVDVIGHYVRDGGTERILQFPSASGVSLRRAFTGIVHTGSGPASFRITNREGELWGTNNTSSVTVSLHIPDHYLA